MKWLIILIVVIVIGAIIGWLSSDSGERGSGAAAGGCLGGFSCLVVLFNLMLVAVPILLLIWLFS